MSESRTCKVLGLAGSLREGSFNRMLLRSAIELAPDAMQIEEFDIGGIPLYNADVDTDDARPRRVQELKTAIAAADGVLIVSPEYNHAVPGVMQNVIDWASRPAMKSPLRGKPVAIMGASSSLIGTARGQQVLKLTLLSTMAMVMPHPGVTVAQAREKFGDGGTLRHEPTRTFLSAFLGEFQEFVTRLWQPY